jgi:hypothetical protein
MDDNKCSVGYEQQEVAKRTCSTVHNENIAASLPANLQEKMKNYHGVTQRKDNRIFLCGPLR